MKEVIHVQPLGRSVDNRPVLCYNKVADGQTIELSNLSKPMALDCGGSTSSDRCQEQNEKFCSFFFAPKIRNEIRQLSGAASGADVPDPAKGESDPMSGYSHAKATQQPPKAAAAAPRNTKRRLLHRLTIDETDRPRDTSKYTLLGYFV